MRFKIIKLPLFIAFKKLNVFLYSIVLEASHKLAAERSDSTSLKAGELFYAFLSP